MDRFRHALWSCAKAVRDVSGFSGTGVAGRALRAFLRDENDAGVRLSQFAGLTLGSFFAHSEQALRRVEEEVRIGIRRNMPLAAFSVRLRSDLTLAVLALEAAQRAERETSAEEE